MPISGIKVYPSSSFQPHPVRDKNKAFSGQNFDSQRYRSDQNMYIL